MAKALSERERGVKYCVRGSAVFNCIKCLQTELANFKMKF